MTQKHVYAVSVLALTMAIVPACATKKLVRTEVGAVNAKVDTLNTSVEATQERTRQTETKVAAVDAKAEAAGRSAVDARAAADAAQVAADRVGNATTVVDGRVTAVEAHARRLIYEVTLSEDQGNFLFNGAALPDAARPASIRWSISSRTDPKGVFIEIEVTPTTWARPRTTSTWASSAPTWSSGISTNSTRCRCTRST
jgi:hypothetical protein